MTDFAWDYVKLAFLGGLGVIQIASAYSGFRGLFFFPTRTLAAVAGVAMTVTAFLWFFMTGPRNLPDTTFGLDGNEQARFFAIGGAAAVVFSLLFSSVRNATLGTAEDAERPGFEALKHTTFVRAFAAAVRKSWKLYSSRFGEPTSQ